MAAGTIVARITGYVRSVLLVAALGTSLHADLFAVANTIPTVLVFMLGAGVVNAVLVPQVVRADRRGEGAAYVNQVMTLLGSVLLVGTVVLTIAAPLVVRLFLASGLQAPAFAEQRSSAVALAFCCLPQVFFYGVFTLVGQVLNARGVFGPMMWAPVANNVVATGVLVLYLVRFGTATEPCGAYTTGQVLLLGIGSTAGVLAQCLVLVPFLRGAGIRFRPTVAVLSPRMRRTVRLGAWTVAVVLVNQIAYAVVVRSATAGTTTPGTCVHDTSAGTGYTVYSAAFLVVMALHGVVTVSVTTAAMPGLARLAEEDDRRGLGGRLGATLTSVLVVVLPVAALITLLGHQLADLAWGYGAGSASAGRFAPTLTCFAVALVFFTAHYVALRGLYALEATRAVLGIQVVVALVNVAGAVLGSRGVDATEVAPRLAAAYGASYAVGATLSWSRVRRRLGTVGGRRAIASLTKVGVATSAATATCAVILHGVLGSAAAAGGKGWSAVVVLATTASFLVVFVAAAHRLRVREVTEPVRAAWRVVRAPRSPRRSRPGR